MTTRSPVVSLFDVDNTLLDNDRIAVDLRQYLEREFGHERQARYWAIFEGLQAELGYADYLRAPQPSPADYPRDSHVLMVSTFLLEYPFPNRQLQSSLYLLGPLP